MLKRLTHPSTATVSPTMQSLHLSHARRRKNLDECSAGIPNGAFVNSVKEDPKQKGLLYAATELRVYVSFNDGDQWQPLELNMPVTSVRDLIVHGDDLAVATHGRGFWVLDQMTPLRQIAAEGETRFNQRRPGCLHPETTWAIHQGGQNGTPFRTKNRRNQSPAGVVAYYWLKSAPAAPIKLELVDAGETLSPAWRAIRPSSPSTPRRSTYRRIGNRFSHRRPLLPACTGWR